MGSRDGRTTAAAAILDRIVDGIEGGGASNVVGSSRWRDQGKLLLLC